MRKCKNMPRQQLKKISRFSVIAVWHGTITPVLAAPADQGDGGFALKINK